MGRMIFSSIYYHVLTFGPVQSDEDILLQLNLLVSIGIFFVTCGIRRNQLAEMDGIVEVLFG